MRRRWAWLATGSGIMATTASIACGPTETTCEESATCPPPATGTGGAAGAPMIDSGGGAAGSGGDAGVLDDVSTQPDADASVDGVKPPDDVSRSDARDADARVDITSPDDTRRDMVPDAPLIDAPSEPDACDPGTAKSPTESTCLISEQYGVFVSPLGSDTTGVGTRSAPFKTLAKGLQIAKGNVMRVYACDDGTGYPDALTVDTTLDGTSLYGGFECTGWTYAVTRRARVRPTTGVALVVKGLTAGLTVEDFEFNAADAAAGASSIGAIVDTAVNVVLRGVKVTAGKGGGGVDGVEGAKGADGDPALGQEHQGYRAECPYGGPFQVGGAWANLSACGSQGGGGGTASKNNVGASGFPGTPSTDVTPPNNPNGGPNGPTGQNGGAGSPGNAGTPGAASSASGSFSAAGYAVAAPGGSGAVGKTGQGGGGGGGSDAVPLSNCVGASGGAGGMGGCGGTPGMGGASAGASIALLSWMSPITLDRCELMSAAGGGGGNGGKGGKGGVGKAGAPGGAGYTGDAGAADAGTGPGKGGTGGPGGNGGNGGSGAGGNGGPSYAIVYKGMVPTKLNGTIVAHGAGGAKGMGGSVDSVKAPDGLVGAAADDFAVP